MASFDLGVAGRALVTKTVVGLLGDNDGNFLLDTIALRFIGRRGLFFFASLAVLASGCCRLGNCFGLGIFFGGEVERRVFESPFFWSDGGLSGFCETLVSVVTSPAGDSILGERLDSAA